MRLMSEILKLRRGQFQLKTYARMYCPDLKNGWDIYEIRGIDRERGCMIVVRPDQYICTGVAVGCLWGIGGVF